MLISSSSLPDTKVAIGLTIEEHGKKAAIAIAEKFYQDVICLLQATNDHHTSSMIVSEATDLFLDDEVEQENEAEEDEDEELEWDWSLDLEDDEEERRDNYK